MITRSQTGSLKPKLYHTVPLLPQEPATYKQAATSPQWVQAMTEEINALHANHTWDLVPSHSSQNLVGCK